MGVSTNAILAFGFDLGEELPEAFAGEEGGFDFSEWAEAQAGMSWTPNDEGYFKKLDAMLAALPVTVETHCSGEYPMYFLALNGSVASARRGDTTAVETVAPDPARVALMQTFCEKHGIEWKQPAWHIFSYWG